MHAAMASLQDEIDDATLTKIYESARNENDWASNETNMLARRHRGQLYQSFRKEDVCNCIISGNC